MVLDLNKIVFHADSSGVMHDECVRNMVVISDMVCIGQGEGPLMPEPGDWKMLAFSDNPTVHDVAMARLFGTDASMIPTIFNALKYEGAYSWKDFSIDEVNCASNDSMFDKCLVSKLNADSRFSANPTSGWSEHFHIC